MSSVLQLLGQRSIHCVAETAERFGFTALGAASGDQGVDVVISSEASLHGVEKESIVASVLV